MPKHIAIYLRVSTKRQDTKSQEPDLHRFADDQDERVKWYKDQFTGRTMNRPGWKQLEADIRAGKVSKLVCWKLDRLGRTARELLGLFDELRGRKVDLICVASGIMGLDSPEGRLMAGVVAMFAEYDNEVRSERILAGQAVAREEGKRWGGSQKGVRKKVTSTQERIIKRMKEDGEPITAIAKAVKLSRPTIYDVLRI